MPEVIAKASICRCLGSIYMQMPASTYRCKYPYVDATIEVYIAFGPHRGNSPYAFCYLAKHIYRGAHHADARAPYRAVPSSRSAADAVPPDPLRGGVVPPQRL